MASLALDHVSCAYRARRGSVQALSDLSLEVSDRELVVLLGPSGCGKTTTLRLIAGLEAPTHGIIRIGDRIVNDVEPRDRDVAMVFQNYALYPHMTVYKNMAFGLKMRGVAKPQIEQAVKSVAGKLGITSLLERKPHQLSGGEKQRVALGRAIVRKPQLFLLDEPLSNLDISLRAGTRAHIKAMQRELATTMIYVTHDQEEAMTLADRIAVVREGTLQQVGTPLEIYQRPANRFVAGFFGSPPMNLLPGNVKALDGKPQFVGMGIRISLPAALSLLGSNDPRQVVLGVRPHEVKMSLVESSSSQDGMLNRGVIRDVELLGDSAALRIAMSGANELTAKVAAESSPRAGEAVQVDFKPESLHVFESNETGRRLN